MSQRVTRLARERTSGTSRARAALLRVQVRRPVAARKQGNKMAQARSKPKVVAENPKPAKAASDYVRGKTSAASTNRWSEMFSKAACVIAHWMGKPIAFLLALLAVIVWAATGPLFGYSDTWQLVINTSTTIVTFLMVFLIQNTQNRDTMAIQLKLSELIIAVSEAENRFATAEDLSDEDLEKLHQELRNRAETMLGALEGRRSAREKKAS
jgi:low affinity Fe/Cu permease